MPIELTWMIPDQILFSRWSEDVSPGDMHVLVEELGIILDAADRTIRTLIDLTDVRTIHSDVLPIYLQSSIPRHPRRGWIALAGTLEGIQALVERLNKNTGREMVRLFATRAEARDYLLSHDTPPPALPPVPEDDSPGADE